MWGSRLTINPHPSRASTPSQGLGRDSRQILPEDGLKRRKAERAPGRRRWEGGGRGPGLCPESSGWASWAGQVAEGWKGRMRLSKTLVDMDMADYSAALDPAYTTLEFENVQVLTMGNGRWGQVYPGVPLGGGYAQIRERVCGTQCWAGGE